jgi:hypothetical protein
MNRAESRPRNPFGATTTRPGALPFRWPELPAEGHERVHLQRTEQLSRCLVDHRRGAIVGPHGSGKSTLLCDLQRCLASGEAAPRVVREVLRDRNDATRVERAAAGLASTDWLLVDGWEQLGWLAKVRVLARRRRGGPRLLVTTHRPPRGFSVVAELATDRRRARALATLLLAEHPALRAPLLERFDQLWPRCEGNLRTLWAAMYESFEEELRR